MKERIDRRLYNAIKAYARENWILYTVARGIIDGATKERYMLLRGYYDPRASATTIIIQHLGDLNQNKIIYYRTFGDDATDTAGFCALLRESLFSIGVAEELGMVPVIKWGEHTYYYDQGMDEITKNVFEYYFRPVSDVPYQEVMRSRNVVYSMRIEYSFFREKHNITTSNYLPDEKEIALLGKIYQKYIHLNEKTKMYLDEEIHRCRGKDRMLGIHIRGTDYKKGFYMHPVTVNPREHLEKAKDLLKKGEYDKVFLATDDLDALKMFQNEIPSKQLVYYDDVLRTQGNIGPHSIESNRVLHHYRLGLEILRDVYTLASCDGLIAGLSQVSFAARYINYALDRHFDDLVILNRGLNVDGKKLQRTIKLKK